MKPMDKKLAGMIMALLVIIILFVPAYASYEIDQRTVTNILTVEGLYENGTVISTYEPVNQSHLESLYFGEIKTGAQANNDSIYLKNQGVNYIHYTNFVTFIGNGTYSVTPNYTIHTAPFVYRSILIPLNLTTHQLAEFDFIRLYSDDSHAWRYITYKALWNVEYLYLDEIRNNTYMIINSLGTKSQLLTAPDTTIYLEYQILNPADVSFNFKIQGFNLDDEHQFFWSDEHLYFGSIAVSLTVMGICALFTTNFVDIKIDREKKRRS